MIHHNSVLATLSMLLVLTTACGQEPAKELPGTTNGEAATVATQQTEPHPYGGWYCPDNFGFVPVDIQRLEEVPAIAGRLPTEQELHDHKSLINVDTEKYPDARALEMDLPRAARIHSDHTGMSEMVIVIQAIVVQADTVVGYRFANGGNGSTRISEVSFLSDEEVAGMGPQPYYFSRTVLKAGTADIWRALVSTDYFEQLGRKFDQQAFFSSAWDPKAEAHLDLDAQGEKATGYVGMVFGNYYLHIHYELNGAYYSEKMLLSENQEDKTTELFFASGPYSKDFEKQKSKWDNRVATVKAASEARR